MKRSLIFPILLSIVLVCGQSATADIVYRWNCEESAANTTVTADVGTGTGSLSGGKNTEDVQTNAGPGNLINTSFYLDGSDSLATPTTTWSDNAAGSFVLWAKLDSVAGTQALVGRTSGTVSRAHFNSTTLTIVNNTGTVTRSYTLPVTLETGKWYCFLACRAAGHDGALRVFVNGQESPTGSQTFDGLFAIQRVGVANSSNYLTGEATWFTWFNSDESANVATLYAEGVPPIKPSLRHYYERAFGRYFRPQKLIPLLFAIAQ